MFANVSETAIRHVCGVMKRCGLKINVYRLTEAYMPIKKAQDRFWPAKVNVDQPLTAIMDNNSYTMYNFCFGDKVLSKYKIEGKGGSSHTRML